MTYDEMIERGARVLCKTDGRDPDEMGATLVPTPGGHGFRHGDIEMWKKYIKPAAAIFADLEAAGYAIVPAEATGKMIDVYYATDEKTLRLLVDVIEAGRIRRKE